jgi:nucleoside-triphosphatase
MSVRIALTGKPGIGKTTVVKKIAGKLGSRAAGFWTEEIRRGGKRWGFKVVRTDGKEELLASTDLDSPFRVSRYGVNLKGFEKLVVPFLEEMSGKRRVLIIDEVGKMELLSESFRKLVEKLIKDKNQVVLTIPVKDIHPLVKKIRGFYGFKVITLTYGNRDHVPERVLKLLEEKDGQEG